MFSSSNKHQETDPTEVKVAKVELMNDQNGIPILEEATLVLPPPLQDKQDLKQVKQDEQAKEARKAKLRKWYNSRLPLLSATFVVGGVVTVATGGLGAPLWVAAIAFGAGAGTGIGIKKVKEDYGL